MAEKGYDVQFGARPLKRAIQRYLEDPLAEEILKNKASIGDKIEVDLDKEKSEIMMKFSKAKDLDKPEKPKSKRTKKDE